MRLSLFKNMFAATGDEGRVITFGELIDLKRNGNLNEKDKQYKPVLQCHSCNTFLVKKDALSFKIYQYWDGNIFIDIDDPKVGGNKDAPVCDWWAGEVINEKLKVLSMLLVNYKWYRGSCLSSSGKGYHILGHIKSKWKSEIEYMASYIQIYNDVWTNIKKVFDGYDEKEILSMLDDHNIYPYQKFIVGGKTIYINNLFDEEETSELNEYTDDNVYLLEMKSKCDDIIVNKVVSKFEEIQRIRNGGVLEEKKYNGSGYVKGSVKPLMKSNKITYFYNIYRFMLVKTLKMFYNKEEAREIAKKVYDDYWTPDHDKDDAYNHIDQIIEDISYFEPKDWFMDVLVNIGVLDKKPIWDYYFDMDEIGADYLSEIMPKILKVSEDITIIESPAASGKTTAIAKMKDNLWMCEPYNPVIKNNFVGKTDDFQCLYDDIYYDKDKFTNRCNKVVSSYNKLLSIDYNVFKDNNIKYLFIDESHTLFGDADFRFNIMVKLIHKIIELIKYANVKVIMMSGTPLKEKELFSIDNDIKTTYIKVKRKHKYNKRLIIKHYKNEDEEILTKNGNPKKTGFVLADYIIDDIKKYIDDGYKILIPYNKGDKKINELMIRLDAKYPYLIVDDDFNIYKRQYRYDDKNKQISEDGNMVNKITFATKYLSVGVSIYNKEKAAILFLNNEFPAYEIEQYALRFRCTDIECVWYVNEKYIDDKKFNFKLIDLPSENEIKMVIKNTEEELKYRGWENWDMILNGVLNAYDSIIKEEPFEMNKLTYDKWSLNLKWYRDSIKNYYKSYANNVYELDKYGFEIKEIDITKKSNIKEYKDKYKEELNTHYCKVCEIASNWINDIDECYLLNGRLEYKNYNLNIEPFVSLFNFAKFCWFRYISLDNIKQMMMSCFDIEYGYDEDTTEYKRIQNRIDVARKSIKKAEEKPDNDKNKKRDLKNAKEKLDKAINDKMELGKIVSGKYNLSILDRYKSLIKLINHKEEGLSKLFRFIVNYVRQQYSVKKLESGQSYPLLNYDKVLDDVADKWKNVCNEDNIDFSYYNNKLKYNIDKMINLLFQLHKIELGVIIEDTIFSHFDMKWFDLDCNRMSSNLSIDSDIYNSLTCVITD